MGRKWVNKWCKCCLWYLTDLVMRWCQGVSSFSRAQLTFGERCSVPGQVTGLPQWQSHKICEQVSNLCILPVFGFWEEELTHKLLTSSFCKFCFTTAVWACAVTSPLLLSHFNRSPFEKLLWRVYLLYVIKVSHNKAILWWQILIQT